MVMYTETHTRDNVEKRGLEEEEADEGDYLMATEIWWKYSIIFGASAFSDSLIRPKKYCSASSSVRSNLWR